MSESKKIIVDEDWKSQVAAEKGAIQWPSRESVADGDSVAESRRDSALPQASFELLAAAFATEAMVARGQFPHPTTGKIKADQQHARFAIDMLGGIAPEDQGEFERRRGARAGRDPTPIANGVLGDNGPCGWQAAKRI